MQPISNRTTGIQLFWNVFRMHCRECWSRAERKQQAHRELTAYLSDNVPKLTDGRRHVGLEQGFQRELFVAGL
jgi:hypothetical protein